MRLFVERLDRWVEFGHVGNASGARNFFGQGYPFHHLARPVGLNFRGSYLVAKTAPLEPRKGNMATKKDGMTPRDLFPDCVIALPRTAAGLNAVGLTCPGLRVLLSLDRWQRWPEPFFLSLMAVGATREERLNEYRAIVSLLTPQLPKFQAPLGLEVNITCPNVGLHLDALLGEVEDILRILSVLGLPILIKINVLLPVEAALEMERLEHLAGIVQGNSLPWDAVPAELRLQLFGTTVSPLAKYGGGGLSGRPLLPLVNVWIGQARKAGFAKPIVGCGGIMSAADAEWMLARGATAVQLGTVCMVRPWRVRGIINHVNWWFEEKERLA
ncbi:hypothetical protein EPO33_05535 [Patescibacteria group bacterium]|nr:MAG: hypothetical protein EPO33_05535 [Patescibacteria group bacterium]